MISAFKKPPERDAAVFVTKSRNATVAAADLIVAAALTRCVTSGLSFLTNTTGK